MLDLAIQCLEAQRGRPLTARDSIDFLKLTLPVPGAHGKPVKRPLEALSVAELRELLRRQHGGAAKKPGPRAKQLARLIGEAGAKHATFTATATGATLHLRYDELRRSAPRSPTSSRADVGLSW